MALTLTFDQPDAGIPAGVVDRGRTDLVSTGFGESDRAYSVFVTIGGVPDGASADLVLLDEPPDSNPLLSQVTPTRWRLEFDSGCWGPFRFRSRAISAGQVLESVTRRCSVRSPKLNFQYPANAERIDPSASRVASVQSVALTEMNEGGTNRALVDFFRELIERVEAAVSDGVVTSPPLFEQLYDESLEHLSGKYRVAELLQAKAELATTARQLEHGADFPVEKSTPGGAPLSSANMAQSIRNAYAKAVTAGGGTVLIPAGNWAMGDEEIAFAVAGPQRTDIKIRGAGMDCTTLTYPTPYTGTAFKWSGEDAPGFFYFNGGMSDLTIVCDEEDLSNTGTAIHIEACINMQFSDVTIRNFCGGVGFKTRKVGVAGTCQYGQLWNFTCAGNGINYDLSSFVNSQGYGVYGTSAVSREYVCTDCKYSIYGGNMQTSCPIAVEFAGEGGNRLVVHDFYYEGFCPTLFKLNSPTLTYNVLDVHGFHVGGNPTTLVDTDIFNEVTLTNVYNAAYAATILKARNGARCTLVNAGDPISLPAQFDLDAASAGHLICLGMGITQYFGPRLVLPRGVGLPSFASGSEPSSPSAGDVVRDSTYDRPSCRTISAWRRLAFVTDEQDISALITPYCAEIFDPQIARLRSVISGGLDSLTGLLNGTVLTPVGGSAHRPTWNASDDRFANRPSFGCANSGDHLLGGTLAAPIPIGSRPGLLLVFRATAAGTDANRRLAALLESPSRATALFVGYGDLNDALHPYAYYISGAGGTSTLLGPASLDVFGHVALVTSDSVNSMYLDQNAVVADADHGNTANAASVLHLGGAWDSLNYVGCDVALAYAAVLSQPLPPELRDRINKLVMTKYGLR